MSVDRTTVGPSGGPDFDRESAILCAFGATGCARAENFTPESRCCSQIANPQLMSPDRKAPDSSRPPEHLKDLLGALPLATVVLGETGVIVFSNELLTELLGWEAEEILGKKFENFLPERLRSAYERLFVEYLLTPAPRALDTVEARWVCRKDGKELPVDIALNFLAQDGATFVVAALHDLSERHRVEQEFRDREQRFRIAAGHAVDVIQEVDLLDRP